MLSDLLDPGGLNETRQDRERIIELSRTDFMEFKAGRIV